MYMELMGTVEVVRRRAACLCIPLAGLGQLCFRQAEATARPPQYAQAWLLQRCRPLWEPPCPCTQPGPPPSSPPHLLPLPFCQAACSINPSIFCGVCMCLLGDMSASKRSISEATVVGPEYLQSARWMGRHPHRSTLQQGAADLYSMLGPNTSRRPAHALSSARWSLSSISAQEAQLLTAHTQACSPPPPPPTHFVGTWCPAASSCCRRSSTAAGRGRSSKCTSCRLVPSSLPAA